MPARIRHSPLVAGLSVTDLPILPFLAPRLLQLWPIPIRNRRAKSTKSVCLKNGTKDVKGANGSKKCLQSWQTRSRTMREQHCLGERARATAPVLLSRGCGNLHVSEVGRRAYSTEATETPLRHDVAGAGVPPAPIQPLGALKEQDEHNTEEETPVQMLQKQATRRERDETHVEEEAPTGMLREEGATEKLGVHRVDEGARRSIPRPGSEHIYILDDSTGEFKLQPSKRPKYSEFPQLIKAWSFMEEAAIGKRGKTRPFSRHWRLWFGNYHEKLVKQKTQRPEQHARMEEEVIALLHYDHKLDIEEIRKLWLEFLNWDEIKGTYVRRIDVSARVADGGKEAIKGRKAMAEGRWPEIMLNVLAERPEDGLEFLIATCVGPLSHMHHYSDVIDYLIKYYLGTTVKPKANPDIFNEDFNHLFDSIMTLLSKYTNSEVAISDFAVGKLFHYASISQAEALYNVLLARVKRMGINTRLGVAETLGRLGATDTAVYILESLHRESINFKAPHVESVCATVLRGSQRDPDQKIREGEIFERFLQFGIQPGINFYNILAHNAVESGDHVTAWKVYDMLLDNGIEPSAHTYSILLNDAKWRLDNDALDTIIAIVNEKDVRNEFIANDIIHATWLIHEQHRRALHQHVASKDRRSREREWLYRIMLFYSRYFEIGPLLDFAPEVFKFPPHLTQTFHADHGKKMHPDSTTLCLMINTALKCRLKTEQVGPLYERYKKMLEMGHPDFVRLAKRGTAVEDAFIKRLGQDPRTLPLCMNVMVDMLTAQETTPRDEVVALQEANESLDPKKQLSSYPQRNRLPFAKPTVKTWTVLMQAFIAQSQPRAAEKVLAMMKGRGVEPDQVTWNQLVLGYANLKDEKGTVDAMVRAENSGLSTSGEMLERMGGVTKQAGIMQQVISKVQSGAKKEKEMKAMEKEQEQR